MKLIIQQTLIVISILIVSINSTTSTCYSNSAAALTADTDFTMSVTDGTATATRILPAVYSWNDQGNVPADATFTITLASPNVGQLILVKLSFLTGTI